MNKFIDLLNDICRAFFPETQVYKDVKKNQNLWEEFCKEKNGKFRLKNTVDYTFSKMLMSLPYSDSEILFKESDTKFMKIEYKFADKVDFTFQITYEDFIEKTIKLISNKEVEIGDNRFDDKYLILTNDNSKLLKLFSNAKLKNLLLKLDISNFQIHNRNGNGTLFLLGGWDNYTKENLLDIYEIITLTIDYTNNNR